MLKMFALILLLTPAQFASAYMMFGAEDKIHTINGITVYSPEGIPMQLAHRVSLRFFIAGIFLVDEGYVFVDEQNPGMYYESNPQMLKDFQDAGMLPKTLPDYTIPLWDYILGFSLWIIVGGTILFYWIKDNYFPEPAPTPPLNENQSTP